MKNPNSHTLDMDEFAKLKQWRLPPLKELDFSWEKIEGNLAKGWNKKQIWVWLSETNRFSYNYLTFLKHFPRLVEIKEEEKRKAQIEQRKAQLAQEKQSKQDRLNAIMDSYK